MPLIEVQDLRQALEEQLKENHGNLDPQTSELLLPTFEDFFSVPLENCRALCDNAARVPPTKCYRRIIDPALQQHATIWQMVGDGNCFFRFVDGSGVCAVCSDILKTRALSAFLFGNQHHYLQLRVLTTAYAAQQDLNWWQRASERNCTFVSISLSVLRNLKWLA